MDTSGLLTGRGSHDLGCGVGHPVGNLEIESGFGEDSSTLFNVGPFESHHDRHVDSNVAHSLDDALSHDVTTHDAAKDIDQHCLDVVIRDQDLEGILDLLSAGTPPTSRKLAGSPPASLMMSMVAIASPAPLTMQPTLPSSLM